MAGRIEESKTYDNPEAYWQQRLSTDFNLTGVGHVDLGHNYNRFLYRARLDALERVVRHCGIQLGPEKSILDVGCGNGFYTEVARTHGVRNYVGLDISEKSVGELTRRYTGYRFVRADVSGGCVPIKEEFDIILAADVLFHITDDFRFNTAISNMASLLKEGGFLILSDVFPASGNTITPAGHVCHRSLSVYEDVFGTCALGRLHIEPIFVILHPPLSAGGPSLFWNMFARLWGYGLRRVASWGLFDRFVPEWLYKLDRKLLSRKEHVDTPNLKWLVARKDQKTCL